VTADNTTYFVWTDSYDADGDSFTYTLQVDDSPDFGSILVEKTGLTNSEYTLLEPEALSNGFYYWRVYTVDPYSSNVSDTFQFELNPINAVAVAMSTNCTTG